MRTNCNQNMDVHIATAKKSDTAVRIVKFWRNDMLSHTSSIDLSWLEARRIPKILSVYANTCTI